MKLFCKNDSQVVPAVPAASDDGTQGATGGDRIGEGPDEMLEFGDAQYKVWHEIYVHSTTEKAKVVEALDGVIAALPSRSNFLDVGAGDGDLTFRISSRFARTVVVEPNAEVRANFESRGAEFINGYFEEADLGDSRFDLILCSQVFWLVKREQQAAFIQKMYEHLAPGGKLVIIMVSPLGQSHDFYEKFFYGYNTTTHSVLGDLHIMGLTAHVIPISFEFGTDNFEDFYSILRLFSVESWLHPVNVSDERIREDIGDIRAYTARMLAGIRRYINENNYRDGRYTMNEEIDVVVVTRP